MDRGRATSLIPRRDRGFSLLKTALPVKPVPGADVPVGPHRGRLRPAVRPAQPVVTDADTLFVLNFLAALIAVQAFSLNSPLERLVHLVVSFLRILDHASHEESHGSPEPLPLPEARSSSGQRLEKEGMVTTVHHPKEAPAPNDLFAGPHDEDLGLELHGLPSGRDDLDEDALSDHKRSIDRRDEGIPFPPRGEVKEHLPHLLRRRFDINIGL